MNQDELNQLVRELKDEVAELDSADEETRTRLQSLVDTLEARLAGETSEEHHADLVDTLRENVERFEVEHPRATGIINQIMVTLSNMGI